MEQDPLLKPYQQPQQNISLSQNNYHPTLFKPYLQPLQATQASFPHNQEYIRQKLLLNLIDDPQDGDNKNNSSNNNAKLNLNQTKSSNENKRYAEKQSSINEMIKNDCDNESFGKSQSFFQQDLGSKIYEKSKLLNDDDYSIIKVQRMMSPQNTLMEHGYSHFKAFDTSGRKEFRLKSNEKIDYINNQSHHQSLKNSASKIQVKSQLYCWGNILPQRKQNQNKGQLENEKISVASISKSRSRSQSKQFLYDESTQNAEVEPIQKVQLMHKFRKNSVANIGCGKNHIAIISKAGEIFMMGQNDHGQLGLEKDKEHFATEQPVQITSLFYQGLIIDQVACGFQHTLAVSKNGKVFSWGSGRFGALGHQNYDNYLTPTEITFFTSAYKTSQEILQIQCGAHHSGLLDIHGDLYMWGAGEIGQLGTQNRMNETKPFLLRKQTNPGEQIKEIALGYYHSLILTDMGRVLQTGICALQLRKSDGQNGVLQTNFNEIKCLQGYSNIKSIKAKEFSAALNDYGKLMIWTDPFHYDSLGGGLDDMARISFGEQAQFNLINIHDYELCSNYILIRSNSEFYLYSLKDKKLSRFDENHQLRDIKLKVDDLSILSCGHNYIIGIRNRMINQSKHHSLKSKSSTKKKLKNKNSQKSFQILKQDFENQLDIIEIENLKNQQSLLDENIKQMPHNNSQNEQFSETTTMHRIENKSSQIGDSSTHIHKISSSHRHTRSGSRALGDIPLLSNYSQDNLSAMNLRTVGNSNQKQDFRNFNIQEQNKLEKQNQNLTRSVIYNDRIDENESLTNSLEKQNNQTNFAKKSQQNYSQQDKINLVDYSQSKVENPFIDKTSHLISYQQVELSRPEKSNSSGLIPKSLRISYEELRCQPMSSTEQSPEQINTKMLESIEEIDQLRNKPTFQVPVQPQFNMTKPLTLRDQNLNTNETLPNINLSFKHIAEGQSNYLGGQVKKSALSERKNFQKDRYKEALKKEITHRIQIESQLACLQKEFDMFKCEVGVDQMKSILQDSQQEYQKLYDLCVQECEKSAKLQELYKKEKNLREQRENQIIDLGDQEELMKNQIRYLEDQLNLMRDAQETEQQSLKQTVLDQQKIIEELREVLKSEKENTKEKVFDIEEINFQLRTELQSINDQFQLQLRNEQQQKLNLHQQLQEQKIINGSLNERLINFEKEKDGIIQQLVKEKQGLEHEILNLQNALQVKQNQINEYDLLFAQMREKEVQLEKQININFSESTFQNQPEIGNQKELQVDQNENLTRTQMIQQSPKIKNLIYQNLEQNEITENFNEQINNCKQTQNIEQIKNQTSNKVIGQYIVKKSEGNQSQRLTNPPKAQPNHNNTAQQAPQQVQKQQPIQNNQQKQTFVPVKRQNNTNINKHAIAAQEQKQQVKPKSQVRTSVQQTKSIKQSSPDKIVKQNTVNDNKIQEKEKLKKFKDIQQQDIQSSLIKPYNAEDTFNEPLNIFTQSSQQSKLQPQVGQNSLTPTSVNLKRSMSNSPIDYLGLKPKSQSSLAPRLSTQQSLNITQQASQSRNKYQPQLQPSHSHQVINTQNYQNDSIQPQPLLSPKIISNTQNKNLIEEVDMGTPSQYSLNITPVVMSKLATSVQPNQMFDSNMLSKQSESCLKQGFNSNMAADISLENKKLNEQYNLEEKSFEPLDNSLLSTSNAISALSKSFDGGLSQNTKLTKSHSSNQITGLIQKKQVKFQLNDSKVSTNSSQAITELIHSQNQHNSNKQTQPKPLAKQVLPYKKIKLDKTPVLSNRIIKLQQQCVAASGEVQKFSSQNNPSTSAVGLGNLNKSREEEIEELYNSLAQDMKTLKGLNNQTALKINNLNLSQMHSQPKSNLIDQQLSQIPEQNHQILLNPSFKTTNYVSNKQVAASLIQPISNIQGGSNVGGSQVVDNLKGKLEQIRKNKSLLEDKIKEYEKKLGGK